MSYGLKGKVRQIVTELHAARSQNGRPRDISLREYLAEKFKDANGQGLTPGHLCNEIGIDPQHTTVNELMTDEDNKYLLPEFVRSGISKGMGLTQRRQLAATRNRMASMAITGEHSGGERFVSAEVFLDPVMRGAVQNTFYPDLIVREEPVAQPTVTVPRIALSDAALADSHEGATIEEGSVTYDTKSVTLAKRARGIKITYEAIQFNSLSLVELYMMDLGRMLGAQLNADAVSAIIDGDVTGGSEAAAVVGVADTSDGITWFDVVRVAIRMGLLGRSIGQVIGNETTALNYMNMPEVKNKVQGSALMQTMLKSGINLPEDLYVSSQIGTSQVAFNDRSASLVQLTAQALLVETEKIVSKQLAGTYASIYTGFAKIQRNASVILDGSIAYSGYPFPSWMLPYQGV